VVLQVLLNGFPIRLEIHSGEVRSAGFSPDGQRVVTARVALKLIKPGIAR